MKLTASEIASLVGGEVSGDAKTLVTGIAPIEDAAPTDVTFLISPKLLKALSTTQAGIVLMKKGTPYQKTAVFVDNPQVAFAKILTLVAKEKESKESGIHKTAVIAPDAKIGTGVSVGAHSVIESGAEIGDHTKISAQCYIGARSKIGKGSLVYPQVVIREECLIGERVIIHSGTTIGADGFGYVTEGGIHHKIPQVGNVIIEDDVEIGANTTVDRATLGSTVVGKGTKVDNLVQIAHNVKIGQGCLLVAQSGVAGSTVLGKYVTLAGHVAVNGHIRLGDRVIVAATSGVPNSVAEGEVVFGTPCRPIAQERRIQAIISRLPKIYEEFKKIKKILKIDQETQ